MSGETPNKEGDELNLTNRELRFLIASVGLQRLVDERSLNPTFKFKILLVVKQLTEISKVLETVRQQIFDEYAEKDEKGNNIVKDGIVQFGKNKKVADEKLNELMLNEVSIPGGKLSIDLNDDIPKDFLSAREMISLSSLVDFKGVS